MKKKQLAWAVLPLAALFVLASCGTSDTSSVPDTTSDVTSVIPSSDPLPPSTSEPEGHTQVIGSFNRTAAEGEGTREFDDRFDIEVEDFSGETIEGTTNGERHNGKLRAIVDNLSPNYQDSTDGAIYKAASGTYEAMNFGANGIGFRIRVAKGSVKLSDLQLELRGGDLYQTYKINLADAVTGDGEKNPELTGEFQDIVINPGQTIDDESTTYLNLDGTASEVRVLGMILGFHLSACSEEVSGIIEIDDVFTFVGSTRTVLDDFNRDVLNRVPNAWWGGSDSADSILVRRGVTLKDKNYTSPDLTLAPLPADTSVVLDLLGDTSGAKVESLDAAGEVIESVDWSALTAVHGTQIKAKAAVNGAYSHLAVALSQFPTAHYLRLSSTTELELSRVFLTSFEEPNLSLEYPRIDTAHAVVFDNFNRTIASLDADWDKSAQLQANINAGINGLVSYAMGDQISTDGDVLHIPAADNYAEVTIGSSHFKAGMKYIVFSMKGADLNLFRFSFNGTDFVYFNAGLAAEGVKGYGDQAFPSPYVQEDGFTWYVFDLEQNHVTAGDLINLYYTGAGAIEIDSIFFAYEGRPVTDMESYTFKDCKDLDLSTYHWCHAIDDFDYSYYGIGVVGDGTATFDSFRVEYNGETLWANNGGLVGFLEDGTPLKAGLVIPTTDTCLWIDMLASGYTMAEGQSAHLHVGGEDFSGTATVFALSCGEPMVMGVELGGEAVTIPANTYTYLGGVNLQFTPEMVMVSLVGDGVLTFESFRIENNGQTIFANNGLVMQNLDTGATIAPSDVIPTTGITAMIVPSLSGWTPAAGMLHFHYGGWGHDTEGTIQIASVAYASSVMPYDLAISQFSE